jgi:hypothetical protein
MRNIFRDRAHQAEFDAVGYVVFDFLDAMDVRVLRDLLDEVVVRPGAAGKREVDRGISRRFEPRVAEILYDYRILHAGFVAKAPGRGEIQARQENTFVDEDFFTAFNLWAPLEDTGIATRCFHLIPGSHRLLNSTRAGSIPNDVAIYSDELRRYLQPLPLEAGQGILYDHRLFHYVPADGRAWWPAATLVVIPNEAQPVFAYYDEQADPAHVQLYRMDKDYLIERSLSEPPQGLELLTRKEYIPLPPRNELLKMLDAHVHGVR